MSNDIQKKYLIGAIRIKYEKYEILKHVFNWKQYFVLSNVKLRGLFAPHNGQIDIASVNSRVTRCNQM